MATKRAPKVSSIARTRTVAYARKTRPTGEGDAAAPEDAEGPDADAPPEDLEAARAQAARYESEAEAMKAAEKPDKKTKAKAAPAAAAGAAPADAAPADAAPADAAPADPAPAPAPAAELPKLHPDDAEPDRAHSETVMMPVQASVGAPPAMPQAVAPAPGDVSAAESPTHMPGPREIPPGNPDDPARPPGTVPSGDSRSLRRRADRYEFALVYRVQTFVISRFGTVGTRGQWRVVEYPTSASASHAYAKECSRFAADGFSDYRD